MYVREVSPGTCCLRMAFPPISLSMASLRLAVRGTLAIALIAIGIAISARPAFAVGEEITDVRVLDNQRTEESTVRSIAGLVHRRHAGGRHARSRARAAQHHGPLLRRQRLVGAARLRRAGQHLGQGQVPLGAGPHRLLVLEQQIDRVAVRARQPVRARQAAPPRRAAGADRFGGRPRLSRSLAVRHLDVLAAAGGGAAPGHPGVPELGRDAARCRLAGQPVRVPRDAALLVRVRALLRRRLDAPGEDPGGLAPRAVLLLQRRDRSGRSDAADRLGPPLQLQRPAGPRDQGGHLGLRPRQSELRFSRAGVRGHDRRRRSA